MAALSGSAGLVKVGSTAETEVTGWTFDEEAPTHNYASSSSGGFKNTTYGPKMCKGTIKGKFDLATASLLVVGSIVALHLYVDATHHFDIPNAVIKSRSVGEVDIDNGDWIGVQCSWESNGSYTIIP